MCVPLQKSCVQTNPCPTVNMEAEKYLNKYLSSKKTIDNLRQKRRFNLNDTSFKKIQTVEGEENKKICSELSDNAPWLKNFKNYSFYETDNYYFIVMYSISENTYEHEGISIYSKEYERLATVIDF